MTTLTKERIAEIDALAEKATKGEWTANIADNSVYADGYRTICQFRSMHFDAAERDANALLIAALRNAWPALRDLALAALSATEEMPEEPAIPIADYPSRSFQHAAGRRTVTWEDWQDMQANAAAWLAHSRVVRSHAARLSAQVAGLREERDAKERAYREEYAIVDRCWKALGIADYKSAKPYAIDEHIAKLRDTARREALEEAANLVHAYQQARADHPGGVSSLVRAIRSLPVQPSQARVESETEKLLKDAQTSLHWLTVGGEFAAEMESGKHSLCVAAWREFTEAKEVRQRILNYFYPAKAKPTQSS